MKSFMVGPPWGLLGPSWGHLGAILGPLVTILGQSRFTLGAILGPLGAILGPSWGLLGAILGPLGLHWQRLAWLILNWSHSGGAMGGGRATEDTEATVMSIDHCHRRP